MLTVIAAAGAVIVVLLDMCVLPWFIRWRQWPLPQYSVFSFPLLFRDKGSQGRTDENVQPTGAPIPME